MIFDLKLLDKLGAQLKRFIPPEEENFIDEESGKLDVYQIHLNGDGEPRHNLGGDLHCPTKPETILTWRSMIYIALFLVLVLAQIASQRTKGSVSFHWENSMLFVRYMK